MKNSTIKAFFISKVEEPIKFNKTTALEWVDKERHNGKGIFWEATRLILNKRIKEAAIILTAFLETEIYKDVCILEYISKKIENYYKDANQPFGIGHVRDIMYRLKDAILNERDI